jgi:hypothetical protein
MEGPNGERVVVGRPTGVAGGFLPERLEQLGQEGVRVVDDPEQSGKGTVALRTGARGRPPTAMQFIVSAARGARNPQRLQAHTATL